MASTHTTSTDNLLRGTLRVGSELVRFVEEEALTGLDIEPDYFWTALSDLVDTYTHPNRALLDTRTKLQEALDRWHKANPGPVDDLGQYATMLGDIGYLFDEGDSFEISTTDVDPELSTIAGPQLVVPITNARYALNAANARWGSLYDAFYGTDALGSSPPAGAYSRERGQEVVDRVRSLIDEIVPLEAGSHRDSTRYWVEQQQLWAQTPHGVVSLAQPDSFVGYAGSPTEPDSIVLRNNGLHLIVIFNAAGPVGRSDRASIDDVVIESAVTAILDFEDSVATVDAADKAAAYRNCLGLMKRTLTAEVTKAGNTFTRRLNDPHSFVDPGGERFELPAQATLLMRNVGHLTTTPAILDADGNEVFEGILDAMFTSLCALHDVQNHKRNSPKGSIYIVKPKMHGPQEVAFACNVLGSVEKALGIAENTIKIGIMDEERRTTLNLAECLRVAKNRVVFINTGFLDRTGDEIHTSMHAGPMVPKTTMKQQRWISSYEAWNVETGLRCGLVGRAQIGKGMWAAPEAMANMLETKIGHPKAGATCAWVPSPTAATLHALHYHRVNVAKIQEQMVSRPPSAQLADLLVIPLREGDTFAPEVVQAELENNLQGILGYVVRWIDQGVGCSTVPDINGVGLMEDRATCRISSQHVANWLLHGVVSPEQVDSALCAMAMVVDEQNSSDPNYTPMAPSFSGHAFLAARELVFDGAAQPNGYTELILHRRRRLAKAKG